MLDQLFGALLFLFGFSGNGSVRGESTPSASATPSATAESNKNIKSVKLVTPINIATLQAKFEEKHAQAVTAMEAKRASFSASLQIMKDEKKRAIVESIQNQFAKMNEDQTALLMGRLKKLSTGVEEMQKVAEEFEKESGKDLSSVASSLSLANTAITDAIAAVTAQAEKTYSISVTSEANAKNDVGKVRKQIASDLKKVRDSVQNARKKVGDAFKALKTAIGKPVLITVQSESEETQ